MKNMAKLALSVIGHRAELERHDLAVRPRYHVDRSDGVAEARAVGGRRAPMCRARLYLVWYSNYWRSCLL